MFGGGKGGFVRTRISATEVSLSWLIVAGIVAVGGAIYLSGQTYDESLFGLDPASLASTKPARVAANTIVVPSLYQRVAAAAPVGGAAAALSQLQLPDWPAGGGLEQFTPATLYEKINGRAEQYISYEVVGLSCASLVSRAGDRFVDVYVYDMGTPERAFGIYSVERDPAAERVELGRRGYRSGASLFLWHGNFYVQILASGDDAELRTAVTDAATDLLTGLPDAGSQVSGLAQLAIPGLVPHTEKYYARNALGFGFLTKTWSAEYVLDGATVTLFVSVQDDDSGADDVVAGYRGYLGDFGAVVTESDITADNTPDGVAIFGDMDGYYDVIRRQGRRVAGAALLEDRTLAQRIDERLLPALTRTD